MKDKLSIQQMIELVQLAEQQGDSDSLLAGAQQLLLRDPNNPEFLLYKLKALDMQGKVTTDLGLLQTYAKMRSTDVTAFLLLYKAYVTHGYVAEGLIALAFALSIDPHDQECQQLMANLLAEVNPKYTSVKINILTTNRIGHLACEIEPWARQYQASEDDTCLYLFLSTGQKAANPYLYELLKNVAHVIDNPFFYQLYHSRPLLLADEFYGKFPYDLHSGLRGASTMEINGEGFSNLIDIYQNYPPCLRIPEDDASFAWQYLAKHGVSASDQVVLLHVRDSAYLAKKFPQNDFSYHDFRDADIATYEKTVLALIDKGYKVIRIGSDTNQSLAIDNKSYIDLCVNRDEQHGDFYEIFLMNICKFFVANFSGPYGVAALFDTPTIVVNGTPLQHPYMRYGRFIPKLLYKGDEQINIVEVCQGKPLSETNNKAIVYSFNEKEFAEHGYRYKDNSEQDILDAVLEFEALVADNQLDQPLTELQQAYYDALPDSFCHKKSKNVVSNSFLKAHSTAF